MKKGFSLIELVIVVLIIGILAAVALPLYNKAVEKSRASEVLLLIKRFKDVQDIKGQTVEKKDISPNFREFKRSYPSLELIASNAGGLSAFNDGQARLKYFDYVITDDASPFLYRNIVAIRNSGSYIGYALFVYNGAPYCMEERDIHVKDACYDIYNGDYVAESGNWKIYKSNI